MYRFTLLLRLVIDVQSFKIPDTKNLLTQTQPIKNWWIREIDYREKLGQFTASYTVLLHCLLQIKRFIPSHSAYHLEKKKSSLLFSLFINGNCMINRFKSSNSWLQSHRFIQCLSTLWHRSHNLLMRVCSLLHC